MRSSYVRGFAATEAPGMNANDGSTARRSDTAVKLANWDADDFLTR
jgi:hypothetical protein